jgi:branched-chain amino acid transport system substrate-binding protein
MRSGSSSMIMCLIVGIVLLAAGGPAHAQQKEFKLGVLNSLTGPFAPAGALAGHRGALVAIDMINARGGVAGQYKVVPIVADAESKPDVAIREGQRLMAMEDVPVVMGVFSSAIAVPLAPLAEKNKKIFWVNIAISDKVLEDRHQKYVFRVQAMGSQWGQSSVQAIKENCSKFGYADPKDIRVAVIHEDGPYGTSTSRASLDLLNREGMNVVLDESYSVKAQDLSSLILKLKAANPTLYCTRVIFPTWFFSSGRRVSRV